MRRESLRAVVALLVAGGLLFGLLRIGQWSRDRLNQQNFYSIAFTDIRCETPPGLTPAAFLAEVQYLGSLPDQVNVLEPRLTLRLAAAFKLHPWVETVDAIALRGPDGPHVRLRLRTPALAAAGRVLDATGVLLPAAASADGLLELRGTVPPPVGPAGAPWGDANVEGAARTAAWLREVVRLTAAEVTSDGLVLVTTGGVKVTWGRPVGVDPQGELTPEAKRERLRELTAKPDGPREVDVRKVE